MKNYDRISERELSGMTAPAGKATTSEAWKSRPYEPERLTPFRCLFCDREIRDMEIVQVGLNNGHEWEMVHLSCGDPEQAPNLKEVKQAVSEP